MLKTVKVEHLVQMVHVLHQLYYIEILHKLFLPFLVKLYQIGIFVAFLYFLR